MLRTLMGMTNPSSDLHSAAGAAGLALLHAQASAAVLAMPQLDELKTHHKDWLAQFDAAECLDQPVECLRALFETAPNAFAAGMAFALLSRLPAQATGPVWSRQVASVF